jgi:hypothetical protein
MEWSRSSTLSRRSFWCKESKGEVRSGENRAIPFLQTSPEFRWFCSTPAISVSNEHPDILKVILRIIWDVSYILTWSVARGAIRSPSAAAVDARRSYSGDQKVAVQPLLSSQQSPRSNPLTKSSPRASEQRRRRPLSRRRETTPSSQWFDSVHANMAVDRVTDPTSQSIGMSLLPVWLLTGSGPTCHWLGLGTGLVQKGILSCLEIP